MKKIINIAIFILFIGGLSFVNFMKKDEAFSEFENRPLTQFPKFTFERLVDGTFTAQLETYMTDQFFGKIFWTGLKAKAEQTVLKQENNGVYFGKSDMLFEKPEEIPAQLKKNIDSVNQFQKKNEGFPITFVLAPTSIDLYPENLPLYAKTGMHAQIIEVALDELNEGIQLVDPLELLKKKKDEPIYFRTDHHWTTFGAFYTYQAIAKKMGLNAYQFEDFNIEQVSNTFYGTFYAKGNDHSIPPDAIDIFKLKKEMHYRVEADSKPILDGLYDERFLDKRDQYAYFLGGNHAKTIITSSVNNGKKLLLIKDSYAHAIVPFLANHFEEIHMLDLRYYNASIQQYIEEHGLTEGLILYNSPNFAKDNSVLYLKY